MEETSLAGGPDQPQSGNQRLPNFLPFVIGVIVTLNVFIVTLTRWGSLEFTARCVAILLCSYLVFYPTFGLWREKSAKRKLSRAEIVTAGYCCLQFVMIVLNR